jgi:hypothetical protein
MISRAMSSNASRGQGKFIRRPFSHFGVGSINQIEVRAIVPIYPNMALVLEKHDWLQDAGFGMLEAVNRLGRRERP